MSDKYKLIGMCGSNSMHRLQALKNFGDVKEGDLGGWVGSEKNLSQKGKCWINIGSIVTDSLVIDDVIITDSTIIKSTLHGNSVVHRSSVTKGSIRGNTEIKQSTIYRSTLGDAYIENSNLQNIVVDGGRRIVGLTVKFGTITKDITDPKNKIWLIHAIFGVLPVSGVYTFFQYRNEFEFTQILNPYPINSRDPGNIIAVEINLNDVPEVKDSKINLENSIYKIKQITTELAIESENISKLDLIMGE